MGLTEDLRAAVDQPPAPSFDLDQLIQGTRVRRGPSRTMLSIAGFAAVAMVLVGGYALKSSPTGHHSSGFGPAAAPASTHTSAPPTLAPTVLTENRLTAILAKLPKSLHVPTDGSASFRFTKGSAGTLDYYNVSWKHAGITYFIDIFDEGRRPDPKDNGCAPGNVGETACARTVGKDGITYKLTYPPHHAKASSLTVDYFAPDGTHITIDANAGNKLVLAKSLMAVLVAAAHNPGLTLHP